ncbi:MAG: hypothetical protein IK069_01485 [Firmicutes bacterium]|nr:hypothetical protein [Bacillota bacterium]
MDYVNKTCPHCGAILRLERGQSQVKCEYCDSVMVFNDVKKEYVTLTPEQAQKYKDDEPKAVAEVKPQESASEPPKKKSHLILWILGWIFIWPLPLTKILLKKEDMNATLRWIIIVFAWVIYLGLGRGASA